jgi:protein-disulfide isomerase
MKSSTTIPLAIAVGGIIVALAVYASMPKRLGVSGTGNPALVRPVDTSDHILGNPAAKVMLVEYADFDCDFCKGFNQILQQIVATEGAKGDVAWVFREFPLTEIHPNAMKHAEAAECIAKVAGNDAFWKFSDALYTNQPVDPSQYGTLAKAIDTLPGDAFASCYASAATTVDARVKTDRQNALDMGAIGTPFSVILVTGKAPVVVSGSYTYDEIKQMIDQALAGA